MCDHIIPPDHEFALLGILRLIGPEIWQHLSQGSRSSLRLTSQQAQDVCDAICTAGLTISSLSLDPAEGSKSRMLPAPLLTAATDPKAMAVAGDDQSIVMGGGQGRLRSILGRLTSAKSLTVYRCTSTSVGLLLRTVAEASAASSAASISRHAPLSKSHAESPVGILGQTASAAMLTTLEITCLHFDWITVQTFQGVGKLSQIKVLILETTQQVGMHIMYKKNGVNLADGLMLSSNTPHQSILRDHQNQGCCIRCGVG